jgi:hypothetical protein
VVAGLLPSWKKHFYVQASLGAGDCGEAGAVGFGDGADDGQAEAVAFAVADSLAAELPEGLEQVVNRVRRDEGAGVADRDGRAVAGQAGADRGLAAGDVVPDALSMRLTIRLSARLGSPVTGAGARVVLSRTPRPSASPERARTAFPAMPARSRDCVRAAWAAGSLLVGGLLLRLRDA